MLIGCLTQMVWHPPGLTSTPLGTQLQRLHGCKQFQGSGTACSERESPEILFPDLGCKSVCTSQLMQHILTA